ncbi:MAG: 50S ribosomal protein L24e [Candidatus Aenigmarchaeota archaeon]|nr:50S ribosomal protein L24e [Candidatus Aenigmarchaeota archaeon]
MILRCSFCGGRLSPGRGKMLVLKSGTIRYFCSKKCEKNWKMGRDPKKVKWVKFSEKKE